VVLVQDRFSASQKTDPAHLGGSRDGGELMKNISPGGYFRSLCFDRNCLTPIGINTLLIEDTNPTDATSAVNLVNDYFAGKEKYSVDWDDYKQRIADVCGVNKSDGEFNVLYEQASDYAYELIMQYRDEHGGKDPTSAQITDYLIDGVTKTRIDTGERSWFGFGSPEYKESPLTPAEWFNRGVYNDPAEDYDADRGVYVVKTRRGTFTATEEQYQRIVDGEDADVVLSR
jgi:hypothetical protein